MIMSNSRASWRSSCSCCIMIGTPTSSHKIISWVDCKRGRFSSRSDVLREASKSIPSNTVIESKCRNMNSPVLTCDVIIIGLNKGSIWTIYSKSISLIIDSSRRSVRPWVNSLSLCVISDICNHIPWKTSSRNSCWRRILTYWDSLI